MRPTIPAVFSDQDSLVYSIKILGVRYVVYRQMYKRNRRTLRTTQVRNDAFTFTAAILKAVIAAPDQFRLTVPAVHSGLVRVILIRNG